jgi:hypothetical protein
VCAGVAAATVNDAQAVRSAAGLAVGVAATLVTALFQIWAGTKQRELRASSMQLLHAYTPQAAALLAALVPLLEPLRPRAGAPPPPGARFGDGSLLGYRPSPAAAAAILASAALGLLVSLSTFLVVGATSPLTYNVVVRAPASGPGLRGLPDPSSCALRARACTPSTPCPPLPTPSPLSGPPEDDHHPGRRLPAVWRRHATQEAGGRGPRVWRHCVV